MPGRLFIYSFDSPGPRNTCPKSMKPIISADQLDLSWVVIRSSSSSSADEKSPKKQKKRNIDTNNPRKRKRKRNLRSPDNIDVYGVKRGACEACDACPKFFQTKHPVGGAGVNKLTVLCVFCGCPPARHANVSNIRPNLEHFDEVLDLMKKHVA